MQKVSLINGENRVYGMHPYGHDSAICHIDWHLKKIFAISLERVTRVKHDSRFSGMLLKKYKLPVDGSHFCFSLKELNGLRFKYFDYSYAFLQTLKIIQNWKKESTVLNLLPLFKRIDQTVMGCFFYFLNGKLQGKDNLDKFEKKFKKEIGTKNVTFSYFDHHTSHAATAYYFAPEVFIENTMIVTLDGQGDGYFSKIFIGNSGELSEIARSSSEYSLNLLYSLVTGFLGFIPNADEGKLEALASYSSSNREQNPFYVLLKSTFYFDETLSILMKSNSKFPFDKIRKKSTQILDWMNLHFQDEPKEDIAFGMQTFYEDFITSYVLEAQKRTQVKRLALAGGGFANVKLNRRLYESGYFEQMFVFPAMGDDGATLGALILESKKRGVDLDWVREIEMPFFGPQFSENEIEAAVKRSRYPIKFDVVGEHYSSLLAKDLFNDLICAVFQDQMEFGPRALGNRSILANPLSETVKDQLNLKFKKREWFQPFCPSILKSERDRLFITSYNNKHMTCAFTLKPYFVEALPGISHVDGTARAQFVTETTNQKLHNVLKAFKELSGYGVLLNTSFNIHGKTIVLTPEDALDDFMSCSIDAMYIGNFRITRK